MTIDRLKRVLWRLQEMKTDKPHVYTSRQVRQAIMEECGTDERTIQANMLALRELRLLESAGFGYLRAKILDT